LKEEYERDGDTRRAVIAGLEQSARLITDAAAMIVRAARSRSDVPAG
jgi:hypothetical protein